MEFHLKEYLISLDCSSSTSFNLHKFAITIATYVDIAIAAFSFNLSLRFQSKLDMSLVMYLLAI